MKKEIENLIKKVLSELDLPEVDFVVEHPTDSSHGDYSTNVAMEVFSNYRKSAREDARKVASKRGFKKIKRTDGSFIGLHKEVGNFKNPKELAEKITDVLTSVLTDVSTSQIEKVEVAPPGFINFHLSRDFFAKEIATILEEGKDYGKNSLYKGKKVMVEYTDPNIFKPLHIGHLMSNAIGESISRLVEYSGAEVKRAYYSGDVGLHVAKALWGMKQLGDEMPPDGDSLSEKTEFMGNAYIHGSEMYEESKEIKEEIDELNIRLYKGSAEDLKNLYKTGKDWSLAHFQEIFELLGTKFDFSYFESQTAEEGERLVRENTPGVFEKSQGAIVYKGEGEGLHTRVFITSKGVPTYEGKELALPKVKYEDFPYDESIVVTADEQKEYFRVVMAALSKIEPELAEKTKHVTHGMMQLESGKMSSRKGDIVTGDSLLRETKERVEEIISDRDDLESSEKNNVARAVSVAAIKYSVLRQSSGKNIVYDEERALSFEGDSGPYLQYTRARALSVIEKARRLGIRKDLSSPPEEIFEVEKILYKFPEVLKKATVELEPHHLTNYLTELAGTFNSFYAEERIASVEDEYSSYKLSITLATAGVLKTGLNLLGMSSPERM